MNLILFIFLSLSHSVFAKTNDNEVEILTTQPIDGIPVEAIEVYELSKSNEFKVGLSTFPLDPYHFGFGLNAGYTYRFTRKWAYEGFNGHIIYPVKKNLTSKLADDFDINPQDIETMNMVFSTNIIYTHSHGKFIFESEYIRYFKSSFLLGIGSVLTNQRTLYGPSMGAIFDMSVTSTFSWTIELRNILVTDGAPEFYLSGTLGTGINF